MNLCDKYQRREFWTRSVFKAWHHHLKHVLLYMFMPHKGTPGEGMQETEEREEEERLERI